jgi:hypothetical protein
MVDFIISLDGYAAAEGWPGWWGLEGPDPSHPPMRTLGSLSLCRALLEAGLVDRYRGRRLPGHHRRHRKWACRMVCVNG